MLNWLRDWFRRNHPQPVPTPVQSTSPPVAPVGELMDRDYGQCLTILLEEVGQGASWGQLQGVLIIRGISKEKLAQWLRQQQECWQAQPEEHLELAKGLAILGKVARGELAEVARAIAIVLGSELDSGAGQSNISSAAPNESSKTAEDWLDSGDALLEQGHYQEAITSYDEAIKIDPNENSAWYNRGNALANLGHFEEAIASYDEAIKIDPNEDSVWHGQGLALAELGRYEKAIASFDQAIKINPNDDGAWHNRGAVLAELGHYQEAIASYDQTIKINLNRDSTWYNRGAALAELGHYQEAIASYDQTIKINPNEDSAWHNRGVALAKLGHYQEAIASFDQTIKINPNEDSAWFNRGNALFNLGRFEEAIASFDQALKLCPNHYLDWGNRGFAARYGRYELTYQQQFLSRFQFSLSQSQNSLMATFAANSLELEATQRLALLSAIRQPLSATAAAQIHQDSLAHPSLSNPALNRRGYEGELASLRAELDRAIQRNTDLEGWGMLHYWIGKAHVAQAHSVAAPRSFWQKAEASFKTALQTLNVENGFAEQYLEVLQDLIRVLVALNQQTPAKTLQQEGSSLIDRLLADPNYPSAKQRSLRSRAASFNQITVDVAAQAGRAIAALELAEQGRNTCLRWLLGNEDQDAPSDSYAALRSLLTPKTAILYWHLSPSAIITFILLPDCEQPLILPSPLDLPEPYAPKLTTSEPDQRPASLKQLIAWENWLNEWNRDYESYSSKKGNSQSHSWRQQLSTRLTALGKILNVPAIRERLQPYAPTELILMPHRDLHRFPLQYFFETPCTHLPSAHLNNQPQSNSASYFESLLLVENPKNEQIPDQLETFMELESELIQSCFAPPARHIIPRNDATVTAVQAALQRPHAVFHFTGHAAYNSRNPAQSSLFLSGSDHLTLLDIAQLNLSAYQLVCLAACETAVTGKQTITDEYVGLVSAFLKAKATRVVSTFWQVESAASALFIIEFYQSLHENPPAIALQQAQTNLKAFTRDQLSQTFTTWLETGRVRSLFHVILEAERDCLQKLTIEHPYADPYYWSAFSLSGQ